MGASADVGDVDPAVGDIDPAVGDFAIPLLSWAVPTSGTCETLEATASQTISDFTLALMLSSFSGGTNSVIKLEASLSDDAIDFLFRCNVYFHMDGRERWRKIFFSSRHLPILSKPGAP